MRTTPTIFPPAGLRSLATRDGRLRRWILFVTVLTLASPAVRAQSNVDGAIVGQADGPEVTIVVESEATGTRQVAKVSNTGDFRIGSLPPGQYKVTMTKPGATPVEREVNVAIGSTSAVTFDETEVLETLTVSASPVNPIDFERVESVTVLNENQIDVLPLPRDANAVALLAPGTTRGDSAFGDEGNLVSFGGASVAENGYFVNGMNISNFRNGLDPALIPFEAYSQFETLTGAYSAQYGRSTGGVINATTKSGSNLFHGGVNVYYEPDALVAKPPSSFYVDALSGEVTPYRYNRVDHIDTVEANVYASGPLWRDKLFFYGIYNLRRITDKDAQGTLGTFDAAKSDDPFWLIKLDATPFAGHRLEYTGFQDERTKTITTYSNFNFDTNAYDPEGSDSFEFRGGMTHIGRYTGALTDRLTVSAMYGKSEQDRRVLSETDTEPLILDTRTDVQLAGNTSATGVIEVNSLDTREAVRFDLEYAFSFLGEHRLRAGYDTENNETIISSAYASPPDTGYWRYSNTGPEDPSLPTPTVAGVPVGFNVDVARFRVLDSGGSFKVKSTAYYFEDNWTLAEDRLLLRLGVRNEEFENLNANDDAFIHVKNQWAPRVGLSYDLFGDRKTKIFLNYGRYHLPIASNTNARLSGAELFSETHYFLNGLNADFTPILGEQIGETSVLSNGEVPDTRTVVDLNISPMYQDEWVVGVQHRLSKNLTVGVRAISRELGTAIDDMIIDHALVAWGERNGFGDRATLESDILGSFHYVLGNPGQGMTTGWDFDGDDELEIVDLTAEDLEFPTAERKYYSAEFFAEKVWDTKWTAQFSYTWAHLYGNSEGWVLSDNGQDDAGITTMFDTPSMTLNTYGDLPNDVRHHFKLFGAYAFTPEVTLGVSTYLKSGRPINRIGNFNDLYLGEADAQAYGTEYLLDPRGSVGTTPWVFNLDLSLQWRPRHLGSFLDDRFRFQVDIFNVLNEAAATEVYEWAEEDGLLGTPDARFGIPTSWQAPRSVRFSMGIDF